MKVLCAWCQREGKPAVLREVEPLDDPTETHGICPTHQQQLMAGLAAVQPPAGLEGAQGTAGDWSEVIEAQRGLTRWFQDGWLLLLALFWDLARQRAQLQQRIEAAEQLAAELGQTARDLQSEIAGLELENRSSAYLRAQATVFLRQFVTRTSAQLLQPMYDLLMKLEGRLTSTDAGR